MISLGSYSLQVEVPSVTFVTSSYTAISTIYHVLTSLWPLQILAIPSVSYPSFLPHLTHFLLSFTSFN